MSSKTNFNQFVVFGNLTQDLEVNPDHPNIATIHLASNPEEGKTMFVDIAFNGLERIGANRAVLVKGAFVKVTGCMGMDRWTDADGNVRSRLTLSATSVELPVAG